MVEESDDGRAASWRFGGMSREQGSTVDAFRRSRYEAEFGRQCVYVEVDVDVDVAVMYVTVVRYAPLLSGRIGQSLRSGKNRE